MWWLYFKWQWMRDAHGTWPFAQALLAAVFLVLGLVGGWVHCQRRPAEFLVLRRAHVHDDAAARSTTSTSSTARRRIRRSPQAARGARPRLLLPLELLGVGRVGGARARLRLGIDRRAGRHREGGRAKRWTSAADAARLALTSPVLALAIVPLFANWQRGVARAATRRRADFAADMLNSVEPYGVLVTVGDNDTFPLWYAQEVDGIRRDVIVANTSLLNTDWYVRQIIRRPIYEYDAANGPAIYRDGHWTKPTSSPLHMSFADADSYPEYIQLPGPMVFNSGAIHATIDPRRFENGVLMRADALVLRMIQDSWPDRPIYFARSAGGYPRSLGLGDNVLTQGLASKLFVPPTSQTRDTLLIQGDGWLDVARTRALWNDVFTGPRAIVSEGRWVDRPSVSMPALYLFGGVELAEALRAGGDARGAASVLATTRDVAGATRLDDVVRGVDQALRGGRVEVSDSAGVTLGTPRDARLKTQSAEPIQPRRR